jgi:phosphatidylglycerophosphatase A
MRAHTDEAHFMTGMSYAWFRKAGASVLFLGYIPFASGTFGSAAAIGFVWLMHRYLPVLFAPESAALYWMALIGLTGVSFALSGKAREDFGSDDPSKVVVDEFVGQLFAFFLVPITARTLVLGFLLFRFFDIVKPFPVFHMEELEGGVGITMDDVAGGVLSNICLLLILAVYHFVRGALV